MNPFLNTVIDQLNGYQEERWPLKDWAMRSDDRRSAALRAGPIFVVSAVPAAAAIAREERD